LKHEVLDSLPDNCESPLTQGRGLKQKHQRACPSAAQVAPHAGAWIETLYIGQDSSQAYVAPHAGAWIETI